MFTAGILPARFTAQAITAIFAKAILALHAHVDQTTIGARTHSARTEKNITAVPAQSAFAVLTDGRTLALHTRPSPADIATSQVVHTVLTALFHTERTRLTDRRAYARDHLLVGAGNTTRRTNEPAALAKVVADVAVPANAQTAARRTFRTMAQTYIRDALASWTVPEHNPTAIPTVGTSMIALMRRKGDGCSRFLFGM